jgi:glycosyltransferase involved in cell wall biosynthesis
MSAQPVPSLTTIAAEPVPRPPSAGLARNHSPRADRLFDGVICFGDSDWWYHNRGHYDMQMMRQMSPHVPVLYVNSIGVRVPKVSEGGMFLRRLHRKIRSLRRGLVTVEPNLSVFSPLVVPGRLGMLCSRQLLLEQVRWAARRLGIHNPLVWIVCPPAAQIVEPLRPACVVYQRTDAYESLPGVDADLIARFDRQMKSRADLTLFCSRFNMARERTQCRNALFVDHGVDFERFAAAGRQTPEARPTSIEQHSADGSDNGPASKRILRIGRPRAGFVGSIDSHTFNATLFGEVVARLRDVQFVLVGACSLPQGWCQGPNVWLMGQQPYDQVAACMAACDVLIMPWNNNDWIRACNPVKLKEYLAVGRPIVSTPFEELRYYDGLVRVATSSQEFAWHIREALAHPPAAETLRQRVRHETWVAKGRAVLAELAQAGAVPGRLRSPHASTQTGPAAKPGETRMDQGVEH